MEFTFKAQYSGICSSLCLEMNLLNSSYSVLSRFCQSKMLALSQVVRGFSIIFLMFPPLNSCDYLKKKILFDGY